MVSSTALYYQVMDDQYWGGGNHKALLNLLWLPFYYYYYNYYHGLFLSTTMVTIRDEMKCVFVVATISQAVMTISPQEGEREELHHVL